MSFLELSREYISDVDDFLYVIKITDEAVTKTTNDGKEMYDEGNMFSNVPKEQFEAMKRRKEKQEANQEKYIKILEDYKLDYDRKTIQGEEEMAEWMRKTREENEEFFREQQEKLKEMYKEYVEEMRKMNRRMREIVDGGMDEKEMKRLEVEKEKQEKQTELDKKYADDEQEFENEKEEREKKMKRNESIRSKALFANEKAIVYYDATMDAIKAQYREESVRAKNALEEVRKANIKDEGKVIELTNRLMLIKLDDNRLMMEQAIQSDSDREMLDRFFKLMVIPLRNVQLQVKQLKKMGDEVTGFEMIQDGKVNPHYDALCLEKESFSRFGVSFREYYNNNTNINNNWYNVITELAESVTKIMESKELDYLLANLQNAMDTSDWVIQKICLEKVSELDAKCLELDNAVEEKIFSRLRTMTHDNNDILL